VDVTLDKQQMTSVILGLLHWFKGDDTAALTDSSQLEANCPW